MKVMFTMFGAKSQKIMCLTQLHYSIDYLELKFPSQCDDCKLASNQGFPFWIMSYSFGEKLSPKLRDKIRLGLRLIVSCLCSVIS